ncbi:MAG: hypothetical protein U1F81_04520 [Verrucomicrobiaceae bacterium]
MASPYLTKTDFKIAFDCATKLHYRKRGYGILPAAYPRLASGGTNRND